MRNYNNACVTADGDEFFSFFLFYQQLTKKITRLSKLSTFDCILRTGNLYLKTSDDTDRLFFFFSEDVHLIVFNRMGVPLSFSVHLVSRTS